MDLDPNKNYYELLGVPRDASTEQIKEAYKEIARVYHPDSNYYSDIVDYSLNGDQVDIFKAITAAYHTLTNSSKRAAYDQTLAPDLRGWIDPADEDAEILEALEKMGVDPESVGMQPKPQPRRRKNSAAFGIFGTEALESDPQNLQGYISPQFNKTAFGHGEQIKERKRKSTLTNLSRSNVMVDAVPAYQQTPGKSSGSSNREALQAHRDPEADKIRLLLITFAVTGSICFVLSLIAFFMLS